MEILINNSIKIIVFDFDGTLVDSNKIKYDAYFKIFQNNSAYFDIIKSVLDNYYEESRYVIIEKILKRIGKKFAEKEINFYADKYDNIVFEEVVNSQDVFNAEYILDNLYRKYKLYLSSNTPQESLIRIVKYKKWHQYFIKIFGYPNKKVDNIKNIINSENISNNELAVVGDSDSDKNAAFKAGCLFIDVNKIKLNDLLE